MFTQVRPKICFACVLHSLLSVVLGGSNFKMTTNTASLLQSECTSIPIPQDKSNYWFPVGCYYQYFDPALLNLVSASLLRVSHFRASVY
jgi:hypothetical protein